MATKEYCLLIAAELQPLVLRNTECVCSCLHHHTYANQHYRKIL